MSYRPSLRGPPIGGQDRDGASYRCSAPYTLSRFAGLRPVGSMSLDFQVASLSYKSSSFATSRGNEKIGGTGYCVTYDTESQSRNADFILIALRAIPQPSARRTVKLKNPPAAGRSILRTFPSEPSYNMFGRGRLEDLSLLDLSPLQHEHAFGIMVIGAIEDIPMNPV